MKVRITRNMLLIAFVVVLSCVLIARDVLSVSVNKFVLLGICSAFLFVADETMKISMLSFLLPLMCGIPSTYVLLFILVLLAMRNRLKPITVVLFVIFGTLEISALAFVPVSINSTLVKQVLFIFVFFAMLYTTEKVDYRQCLILYFLGAILVCFVIDAYSIMRAPSDWLTQFAKGWYRFGSVALEDVGGMTLRLNPNSLGYFSMSGLLVGLILFSRYTGVNRVLYLIGICFLAISGVLTVSRTWIFVTGGCVALLMLTLATNPKKILLAVMLLLCVILSLFALQRAFSEVIDGLITRMTSSSFEGGNGRVDLMVVYVNALFDDARFLLMGTGAAHYKMLVAAENSVHNGTIQIFMSYGIIGGSIFVIGMLYPLIQNRGQCKVRLISWLPLIGIVLYAQTIQFINPCYLMMPYVIAVYAVKEARMQVNC